MASSRRTSSWWFKKQSTFNTLPARTWPSLRIRSSRSFKTNAPITLVKQPPPGTPCRERPRAASPHCQAAAAQNDTNLLCQNLPAFAMRWGRIFCLGRCERAAFCGETGRVKLLEKRVCTPQKHILAQLSKKYKNFCE